MLIGFGLPLLALDVFKLTCAHCCVLVSDFITLRFQTAATQAVFSVSSSGRSEQRRCACAGLMPRIKGEADRVGMCELIVIH